MSKVEENIAALDLLDNICSQVSLNREVHKKVAAAVNTLRQAIKDLEGKGQTNGNNS